MTAVDLITPTALDAIPHRQSESWSPHSFTVHNLDHSLGFRLPFPMDGI